RRSCRADVRPRPGRCRWRTGRCRPGPEPCSGHRRVPPRRPPYRPRPACFRGCPRPPPGGSSRDLTSRRDAERAGPGYGDDVGADLGIRRSPWRERLIGSEGVVTVAVRFVWGLAVSTTRICMRYRVTGLAAEAGFFALLSFPPLVLGMVASLGYVGEELGSDVVSDLRSRISQLAESFLT